MEDIKIIKLPIERWNEYKQLRLEYLKLEKVAFCITPEEMDKKSDEEWQKEAAEFLAQREKFMFFAEVNGKLIGMVGAYRGEYIKTAHVVVIFGVYIQKEFRGRGVAKKLLQALLNELENNESIVKLNLDVTTTQQAAINLYKSLGFEIVGELKKEYLVDGNFYDVYEMEKYLK